MYINELFAASCASLLISPFMTIIDTSIIKTQINNKNLSNTIKETINLFLNNKYLFFKSFRIMFIVYSSTYTSANFINLYCKNNNLDNKIPLLFGTCITNISMISYKDKIYSSLFSKSIIKFPIKSYSLFIIRDILTISSTFLYKNDVISFIDKYIYLNYTPIFTSLFLPIITQTISTPIHIYAIDIYNNPNNNLYFRLNTIFKSYKYVCLGRILRIIPAFCIGSYINDILLVFLNN
jgi:hypothetical protein